MKLTAGLLLTTSVLAAPRSGLEDRLRARSIFSHQTTPLQPVSDDTISNFRVAKTVSYSNNWAGVVREQPPPQGPYTAVSATFTIPKPTAVSRGPVEAGSAWVGIDGDTYPNAILQAGVDFYDENGRTWNNAWYEWYPDVAYNFDVLVETGDTIFAKVQSLSPSQGVAIIENRSNGQSATQTIQAPNPQATLAGKNADWIVEDFQSGKEMVALADFSSVTFTGAGAEAGGSHFGVGDATVIELKQNDKVLTDVETQGDSQIRVNYVK
ncbi:hypothetical protein FE257_000091 [Aspergillus nanangensis]|uniref:Peptidase A4 family protein n=1 Tax=Aspergillus nanangensis TaxID=2582783 RepID=A0AAD4CYS0_ASPNN|nr:hypothetical protein FE257_000091 [Aspergillus nanangensis]